MDLDNPGPCDSSVLTEQDLHVSSAIWEGEDRGVLKCHEHTKELKMWKLTEAQIKLVEMAGFKHLSMITDMSIDAPLISALVERWRRETNSFHMREVVGKCPKTRAQKWQNGKAKLVKGELLKVS